MAAESTFEAHCERRGRAVVVVAHGELDLSSADRLRAVLDSPEARAPAVVLDLRRLTFIDSSGLSVILGANRRANAHGYSLAIAVGGARAVERVLQLTGLRGTLTIVADPADVLAGE